MQALGTDPGGFVGALVQMMLPLTLGWLALVVLLFGETDEVFANVYSTSVSVQNFVPWLKQRSLALGVGAVAVVVAISIDLVQYESFLFLIGGIFVPVFGILLADYFALRRRRYQVAQLYESSGPYWYTSGFSILAIAVWVAGFLLYAGAAQPPWLLEHFDFVSWVPTWFTHIGGTIPGLIFSFTAYAVGGYWLLGIRQPGQPPASAPLVEGVE